MSRIKGSLVIFHRILPNFRLCSTLLTQGDSIAPTALVDRKQGISIVILNACESARASAGEDANIANNFAKAGVNNVLAMTYQASETVTKLFLESFYMYFLVDGR
jgi:CHAT domain-containing protein